MSDTNCPSCGATTEHWKPPSVLEVQNPFWARIELAQTLCPCGAQLRRARANYAEALRRLRSQDKDLTLLITESNPKLLETFADVTLTIERGEISSR